MKKNSRGFTLVELLVVIAIMGSILVLAITSLNKISKAKKNEAKKKVENQIELAAKQYFEANEYLFENLSESGSGSSTTIPLYKLIESDYLNTLTDPTTGKKFHECSIITIKREKNKKYIFSYDSNNTDCDIPSSYVYKFKDGQEITIKTTTDCLEKDKNVSMPLKNGWCTGHFKVDVSANITKGSGNINKIILKQDSEVLTSGTTENLNYLDKISSKDEKKLVATATTNKGNTKDININYKIDNIVPTVTIQDEDGYITSGTPDKWINSELVSKISDILNYKLNTFDAHSGIDEDNFKKTLGLGYYNQNQTLSFEKKDNKNATKIIEIYDKAQNKKSVTAKAKIDITSPKIETNDTINVCNNTDVIAIKSVNDLSTSKNNVMELKVTDNTSGVNSITIDDKIINQNLTSSDFNITGKTSLTIKSNDIAGNSSEKIVNIKRIGCSYPKLNIKIYKRDKNGNNTGAAVKNTTVEGDSKNNLVTMLINNGNWVNMYDYPYGINIVYKPVDEKIKTATWYENESNLNKSTSESNTYKWGGETTGYKGVSSGIVNDGSVEKGNSKSHKLDMDGYREGRIYATNEYGLTTIVLVKIAKDSTGPTLKKGVSPTKITNQDTCKGLSSGTKYPYIYTSFNAIDTLSGIDKITHYIDGYDDNNKNTTNFYYNKIVGGFISVENGVAKKKGNINFDYVMPKNKSDFKPIESIANGFTIRRNWASVNGSYTDARDLGCGTVGTEVPELDDIRKNCNYLTISDKAGNKLTARVCAYKPSRKYKDYYTFARTASELSSYGIKNISSCAEHTICK